MKRRKIIHDWKEIVAVKIVMIVFIFLTTFSNAQNLVKNPSFEQMKKNELPEFPTFHFLTGIPYWWSKSSSDIFTLIKKTAPENSYQKDTIFPRTGNNFAGLITFSNKRYREYLIGTIGTPLIKNKVYEISIFVKTGKFDGYIEKGTSIALINEFYEKRRHGRILKKMKIIKLEHSDYLFHQDEWVKLKNVFVADGNEKFIIIGTFPKRSKIDFIKLPGKSESGYQMFDDVSITENSFFSTAQDSLQALNSFYHFSDIDSLPYLPISNDSLILSDNPSAFNPETKVLILKAIKYLSFCYPKIEAQINVYYKFNPKSDFLRTQLLKYQDIILEEMDKIGVSHNRLNFRIYNHEKSLISFVIR